MIPLMYPSGTGGGGATPDDRSLGSCLLQCAGEHYRELLLAAGVTLSGMRLLPYPGPAISGGTGGTSIASIISRALLGRAVGRVVGRAIPFVGWALWAYDAYAIAKCTGRCVNGET